MSLTQFQDHLEAEDRAHPARRVARDTSLTDMQDVTLLARQLTGMPMAAVCVTDSRSTHYIAQRGFSDAPESRQSSLGGRVAELQQPVVVCDAAAQPRWRDCPAFKRGLRAFVGVPLGPADGPVTIALCVADDQPRPDAAEKVPLLESLARLVTRTLATGCDTL